MSIKSMPKGQTKAEPLSSRQRLGAVLLLVSSSLFFAAMAACVYASGDIPPIQKAFFRNVVACLVATVILLRSEQKFRFERVNLRLHLLRTCIGAVGVLCNFYALSRMPLGDANALGKLAPFFVLIFSSLFLREKMKAPHLIAIGIAFVGTLFIVRPTGAGFGLGIAPLVAIFGAMCAGVAYTTVRRLGMRGERGPFIVFFFSFVSSLIFLPFFLIQEVNINATQFVLLLGAGIFAACAQFALTAAYRMAPASEISIFDYVQVLFSAAIGYLVFAQIPSWQSWIGYSLVLLASAAVYCYNNGWIWSRYR